MAASKCSNRPTISEATIPSRGLSKRDDSASSLRMEHKRSLMPDWMVSPAYDPELAFERIAINEGALCIECRGVRSAHIAAPSKYAGIPCKLPEKAASLDVPKSCFCGGVDAIGRYPLKPLILSV